ncbi:MAG: hypothetical protein L0Z55_10835 [Planctomycetes bacterium]|nr:hypothetical protein [Planctomycetota bacterium]
MNRAAVAIATLHALSIFASAAFAQDGSGTAPAAIPPGKSAPPNAADPPRNSEEQRFIAAMASDHPDRWVEALARLQFIYEADEQLSAEPWIEPALRDLLTRRADERPARTRKLIEHELLRTPGLGQRVLLAVIGREEVTEATELGARLLMRIAADPARRASLFREMEGAASGPLFHRLFDVLVSVDPAETVLRSIAVLQPGAEPAPPGRAADVLVSVNRLFGTQFVDATSLGAWWSEHRDESIVELLVDAERREKVRVWEQAAHYLKQCERALYRDWLLSSLDRTPPIPSLALADLQQFAQAVRGNGLAPVERQGILTPVVARLLAVVRDAEDKVLITDRLLALGALGEMTDFAHHLPLLDLLCHYLRPLAAPGATGREWELGLKAIEVAGRLEVGVGAELDAILTAHFDAASAPPVPDRDELIRAVLRSLLRLGPRPATIPVLIAMSQGGPEAIGDGTNGSERTPRGEARELALQVLSKWAGKVGVGERSEADRVSLCGIFERTLAQKETSNLRTAAILGLGNLGRKEGIEPLARVVRENLAGDGDNRVYAIRSIASIGGTAGAAALRSLRAEAAARGGDLAAIIDGEAAKLCKLDADYSIMHAYMIDAGGARVSWFDDFVAIPEIAARLEPAEVPPELVQRDGCAHWFALKLAHCRAIEARSESAADPAVEIRAYEELQKASSAIVRFAEANAVPAAQWEEVAFLLLFAAHRATLVKSLAAQNAGEASAALVQFAAATKGMPAAAAKRAAEIPWLLRRIALQPRFPGAREITDAIRKLCAADPTLALSEDATNLLGEIDRRSVPPAESVTQPLDKSQGAPPAGE